jgi:hypothetical protein
MAEDPNPRYRNLRPIEPGEVRNPTGRNGATTIAKLREFLEARAEPAAGRTRCENIWLALYTTAIDRRRKDHVAAARVLLAYHVGKPVEAVELSGPNGGPIQTTDYDEPPAKSTEEMVEGLERMLRIIRSCGYGEQACESEPYEGIEVFPKPAVEQEPQVSEAAVESRPGQQAQHTGPMPPSSAAAAAGIIPRR